MGNFVQDLKAGEEVEDQILYLLKKRFVAIKENRVHLRELYDILILTDSKSVTLEIKADLYKSKNLAFECLGRKGKNTGVIKTSSDYWIHYRNDNYLIWKTALLKRYLLDLGGFIRDCGDDKASAAWIVPEIKILKECPPLVIIEKNSKKLNEFFVKELS